MNHSASRLASVALAALLAPCAGAAPPPEVTLPTGTAIELRTVTPLDSERLARGQVFQAAALRAVFVDGRLVIPRDAVVLGVIRDVRTQRGGAKSAAIAVRFGSIDFPGLGFPIDGALTSFDPDDRRRILAQEASLASGRRLDVLLVGPGPEAGGKPTLLVGTRAEGREDLAEEWAPSGRGPSTVVIPRRTVVAMRLEKPVTLPALAGTPEAGDRSILVSADAVRSAQQALKTRGLHAGEASGILDAPTRRALAAYQIAAGQPATGDLDEATAQALAEAANP